MSIQGRHRRQRWWWWALMGLGVLIVVITSAESPPTEGVSQARLFSIASQLKCVQCVGESVASSSAPIAVEFRKEITAQMGKGKTNDEILNYFASRYDDILLRPPSHGLGALVWVIPVVAVVAAVAGLASAFRRWSLDRVDRSASLEDMELVAAALDSDRGSDTDGGAKVEAETMEPAD